MLCSYETGSYKINRLPIQTHVLVTNTRDIINNLIRTINIKLLHHSPDTDISLLTHFWPQCLWSLISEAIMLITEIHQVMTKGILPDHALEHSPYTNTSVEILNLKYPIPSSSSEYILRLNYTWIMQ
jgi:hypothetical protein